MGYSLPPRDERPSPPLRADVYESAYVPPGPAPRKRRSTARLIAVIFGTAITAFLALVFLVGLLAQPTPAPIVVPAAPSVSAAPVPAVPPVKVAPEPAPPRLAPGVFGDGTYEVGRGPGLIEPGRYHYDGHAAMSYWSRLKDTTGDPGTIIANGNPHGPTTITVKASDGAVNFMGDATWVKVG